MSATGSNKNAPAILSSLIRRKMFLPSPSCGVKSISAWPKNSAAPSNPTIVVRNRLLLNA